MIAWIDASRHSNCRRIFGLTIVERHVQALVRMRPLPVLVIIELGTTGEELSLPASLADGLKIEYRRTAGSFAERLRPAIRESRGQSILLLDGLTVVDSRLHAAIAKLTQSTAVISRKPKHQAAICLLVEPGDEVGDAFNDSVQDLYALSLKLVDAKMASLLKESEFDGFIRKLRRSLPYYLFKVDSDRKAAKVERFMFWSNYKGSTDLFTRYVYPPLVWVLLRPLARWRIHPNLVTLASIVLAFGAIPCWTHGMFVLGFAMAYAMSVLDSVDGKLARLTFTDSRLGNFLDHGLDMVHPPMWYAAWAYGLGIGVDGWSTPLGHAAIAIIVFYVLDRLILKIYPRFFQRAFHTHSRLDGRIRSFIARRNISLPIFMLGYLIGFGREAFFLIVAWQVLTAAYHGSRIFWILVVQRAHRKGLQPTDVAGAVADLD